MLARSTPEERRASRYWPQPLVLRHSVAGSTAVPPAQSLNESTRCQRAPRADCIERTAASQAGRSRSSAALEECEPNAPGLIEYELLPMRVVRAVGSTWYQSLGVPVHVARSGMSWKTR